MDINAPQHPPTHPPQNVSFSIAFIGCLPNSGRIHDTEGYLIRERPVGWLEELSKLEDLHPAISSPHLLTSKSWPVKFRLINKATVLPSQVTTILTNSLYSPDPPLHERSNVEGEEAGRLRAPEDPEILHWFPCKEFSVQVCR